MIEAAQSQVASLKAQMGSTYSDISISAGESDTVVYTFTYAKKIPVNVDSTSLKPVLVKGMKSTMDSLKALVPDVKIKVIYLNPDKSKVADILITQADTDAVSS